MDPNSSSNNNDSYIQNYEKLLVGLKGYNSKTKTILTDAERINNIELALINGIKFSHLGIGMTPISWAFTWYPSLPVLEYLLSKGQRLDDDNDVIVNDYGTFTPLGWIIYKRYKKVRDSYKRRKVLANGESHIPLIADTNTAELVRFVKYLIQHKSSMYEMIQPRSELELPLFCYIVDPVVMKIFLDNNLDLLSSKYEHADYMELLFSSRFLNIEIINFILDYYGDNLLNGTTHIVLFFIKALKSLAYENRFRRSKTRHKKLNRFLDILETRGFDERTPLDATGRTLVMELADRLNSTGNLSKELGMAYPERNIYGRSAAFYKRLSNSQTARRPQSRGGRKQRRVTCRRR